jgi:hypothetical protein
MPKIGSLWFDPKSDPIRIFRVKSYGFGNYISVEPLNRQPRQRARDNISFLAFSRKMKPYVEG